MSDERADAGSNTPSPEAYIRACKVIMGEDAGSNTPSPKRAELDEADIRALRAQIEAQVEVLKSFETKGHLDSTAFEQLAAMFALGNFSSAFVQALGQRAADGAVKRVNDLVKTHVQRKGNPEETQIGVDDGSAVTIAITADTPDEARLALLDLDGTAEELRGKVLCWDSSASAWRPADDK